MTTPDQKVRFLCILEELETSRNLIKSGFGHLQEIDMGNTFYHLAHQLMASGFERLMKCYISLVYKGQYGTYPNAKCMKDLKHNLEHLLNNICKNYYGGVDRPMLQEEYNFVTNDPVLRECMRILSLFGEKGRYYNLDIVSGAAKAPIDPKDEWEELESSVEDPIPLITNMDMEVLYRDYYPRVHSKLIAKMERLVRTIALQFTLGGHVDRFGELRSTSGILVEFRNLTDAQLGTIDYRRSVQILRQKKDNWIRRSDEEIINGEWPTRTVTRSDFQEEWPFREDRVVLECRQSLFYIVNISGYAFALNGATRTKYGMPDPL